ncbi:Uncharacterised protein [Segatella copri]|nr:Uncharacterised protein [Segatella copri]
MVSCAPCGMAGNSSDFSFFTRSILPTYFPFTYTWAKSWNSPVRVDVLSMAGTWVS